MYHTTNNANNCPHHRFAARPYSPFTLKTILTPGSGDRMHGVKNMAVLMQRRPRKYLKNSCSQGDSTEVFIEYFAIMKMREEGRTLYSIANEMQIGLTSLKKALKILGIEGWPRSNTAPLARHQKKKTKQTASVTMNMPMQWQYQLDSQPVQPSDTEPAVEPMELMHTIAVPVGQNVSSTDTVENLTEALSQTPSPYQSSGCHNSLTPETIDRTHRVHGIAIPMLDGGVVKMPLKLIGAMDATANVKPPHGSSPRGTGNASMPLAVDQQVTVNTAIDDILFHHWNSVASPTESTLSKRLIITKKDIEQKAASMCIEFFPAPSLPDQHSQDPQIILTTVQP